jgi:hypothetical protein
MPSKNDSRPLSFSAPTHPDPFYFRRRQEGRYDFEYEIVLVSVAAGTPLKIANLVIEHVHQTEADLVQAMDPARNASSKKAFRQDQVTESPRD